MMKRSILSLVCLLTSASAALADTPFPTFLNGQGAAAGQTSTDRIPVIQGGVTTKAPPTYFNTPNTIVLQPLPGSADNAPQITAALAAYNMVLLSPGVYQVCSQVEVPTHKTLAGTDGLKQGIGNLNPNFTQATYVGSSACPNSGEGSFTTDHGYFHLHDGTTLTGFTINGQYWLNNSSVINCINAQNAMSIGIDKMVLNACLIALDRRSSAVSGDNGSLSQDAVVVHSSFNYNKYGIYCGTGSGGNGCADERYDSNECEVPGSGGSGDCIHIQGGVSIQVLNNRIEDGSVGIALDGAAYVVVNNNFVNRMVTMTINNVYMINFVGNKMSCVEPNNSESAIYISGSNQYVNFTDNLFAYNCIAAFTFSGGSNLVRSAVSNNRYGFPVSDTNFGISQIAHNSPFLPSRVHDTADASLYDWTTALVTLAPYFTTAPTGDQTGAKITEDSSTGTHRIFISYSGILLANQYTSHLYFKQGSSGTRNVEMEAGDGTNFVDAIFNPTTCALVTSVPLGGATFVATPNAIAIGNGWCKGAMSFTGIGGTTGTPVSVSTTLRLASGSTDSYAGDNTSNVFLYSPDLMDGVVAPGIGLVQQP